MGGVEPPTSSLPRMRSNHLSYMGARKPPRPTSLERETGLEPATPSLEGLCSSQLSYSRLKLPCVSFFRPRTDDRRSAGVWWRGEDSNLRRLKPTGLQPVPVDRFGTSPLKTDEPRAARKKIPPRRAPPLTRGAGSMSLFCVDRLEATVRVVTLRARARSWRGDSNLQPADYKSAALPIELRQRKRRLYQEISPVPARIFAARCTPLRRASAVRSSR